MSTQLAQRDNWQDMQAAKRKKLKLEDTNTLNDGIDDELDAFNQSNEVIFSLIMHQQLQTVDYSQSWDE